MRVLGISGSPREGDNTEYLLKVALEAISDSRGKSELMRLADYEIEPCRGLLGLPGNR